MASSSHAPSFFFPDSGSTDKKDVPKPIENPLLTRNNTRTTRNLTGYSPSSRSIPGNSNDNALVTLSDNSLGLRNRKPLSGEENNSKSGPHLPPKASYMNQHRMSMTLHQDQPGMTTTAATTTPTCSTLVLRPKTDTTLLPSTTGCWILVYGFHTPEQYNSVVNEFRSYGHILDCRGSNGRSNWVALQYQSPLEAQKALCHQHMTLACSDGTSIVCGVKHLSDNDPVLRQAMQPVFSGLWINSNNNNENASPSSVSWALTNRVNPTLTIGSGEANDDVVDNTGNSSSTVLEEKDILLSSSGPARSPTTQTQQHSLCVQILRWILSIYDGECDDE